MLSIPNECIIDGFAMLSDVFGTETTGISQLELHPLQQSSIDQRLRDIQLDSEKRNFQIPGRTAAVLVERR